MASNILVDEKKHTFYDYALLGLINVRSVCIRLEFSWNARTFARPKQLINSSPNYKKEPDFPSLADEIAKPRPILNIKVVAFTVSEKSIYIWADQLNKLEGYKKIYKNVYVWMLNKVDVSNQPISELIN